MDIEPIMDEVRDKCLKWFGYNEDNYHKTGRIEQGIALVVNMVVRDVEAQVTVKVSEWMHEERNRRMSGETEDEFKDDVEDAPDPKVTYAKEQQTDYVQAYHGLIEIMPEHDHLTSGILGLFDILHKRLQNLEGGDEE